MLVSIISRGRGEGSVGCDILGKANGLRKVHQSHGQRFYSHVLSSDQKFAQLFTKPYCNKWKDTAHNGLESNEHEKEKVCFSEFIEANHAQDIGESWTFFHFRNRWDGHSTTHLSYLSCSVSNYARFSFLGIKGNTPCLKCACTRISSKANVSSAGVAFHTRLGEPVDKSIEALRTRTNFNFPRPKAKCLSKPDFHKTSLHTGKPRYFCNENIVTLAIEVAIASITMIVSFASTVKCISAGTTSMEGATPVPVNWELQGNLFDNTLALKLTTHTVSGGKN